MSWYIATRLFVVKGVNWDSGEKVDVKVAAGVVFSLESIEKGVAFPDDRATVQGNMFRSALKAGWIKLAEVEENEFGDVLSAKVQEEDDTEYWGWPEIKPQIFHLGTHTGHPGNPTVTAICRAAAAELGIGSGGPSGWTIMTKELPKVKGYSVAIWCPNCQRAMKLVQHGNYYGTLLMDDEPQLPLEAPG